MKTPFFRFPHFLVGIFLITIFSTTGAHAQNLYLGVGYSFSNNISGIDVGLDYEPLKEIEVSPRGNGSGIAWRYGVFFGPARGVYEGGLSRSYIQSEITKQMRGSSLSSYKMPDETDGGFLLGGKFLMTYFQVKGNKFGYAISIGPRLSYFTKQEISVITVSTGGGYEYTEFSQIEYQGAVFVPGVEVNFTPGWINVRYAYMFQPDDRGGMQMLGLSINL